jgi:branched-subunit amino acid transport protein AzlD
MVSIKFALILTAAMGAVIFFCRIFPFLVFRGAGTEGSPRLAAFLGFVERAAPPAAMTVLAFNALASPIKDGLFRRAPMECVPILVAAAFTALVHLWKRNALLSIFGGTALYMVLDRLVR